MRSPTLSKVNLSLRTELSIGGSATRVVCGLDPQLFAFLSAQELDEPSLSSLLRVSVLLPTKQEDEDLPALFGHYELLSNELLFTPLFPFEKGLSHRIRFSPQRIREFATSEEVMLDFVVPTDTPVKVSEVSAIYPTMEILPENLLRFYISFATPMRRGTALEEVQLLDHHGISVLDALYRAPVELWDASMRHLTILLDPGRLKRWLGPNMELGPPLRAGQDYTLVVGSGMVDAAGNRLRAAYQKHFHVGVPVREAVDVATWSIASPVSTDREALIINFPRPLDWASLFQCIRIETEQGKGVQGGITVEQAETKCKFTPLSDWTSGAYNVRIASDLEDVCGNSVTATFDRPLRREIIPGSDSSDRILRFMVV